MIKSPRKNKQNGTAIIVAMFVTAVVATAAIAMIEHLRIDTHRTELVLNNIQAEQYAQGSLAWAIDQLTNNVKQKQPGRLIDRTPIHSPVDILHGAKISSIIYDAQGKLNLNNLTDAQFQTALNRLIQIVANDVDPAVAQDIIAGIVDWITPGVNNSKFEQYYLNHNPPYRAPHHPMASVSELRLIKGMTPVLYTKLVKYVTALPDKTKFNINSISIPVLMSFDPAVTLDAAKAFDTYRNQTPFTTLDALANFTVIKNAPLAQANLTVSSDYFLVKTNVSIGEQHLMLYTLLLRISKDAQSNMIIVWQSKGTL